jgi:ribonuclease HII
MLQLDEQYPQFGFKKNKGYGVKAHMAAVRRHG